MNTCSNAPPLCSLSNYLIQPRTALISTGGVRIYNWTKNNLQNSTDYLYFDNKSLSGKISSTKYTYNSGQMLQAAVMLYKLKLWNGIRDKIGYSLKT
ncbi:MAG: glycoside hydrolase family 76 protein [Prolixibacteraceae bacterium]|nr:glycoside hydrolase family 76 protein [Prolixibacteraceae bacterium]